MPQLDFSSRDVVDALPPGIEDKRKMYEMYDYDRDYEDYVRVGRGGMLLGPMTTMKASKEHDSSNNLFEKFTLVPTTPTDDRKTSSFSTAASTSPSPSKARTTPSVSSNSSSGSSYSKKASSDSGGKISYSTKFTSGGGGIRKKYHSPTYKFFKKNSTPEPASNGKEDRVFHKHRHSGHMSKDYFKHKRTAESFHYNSTHDVTATSPTHHHRHHSNYATINATSTNSEIELSNHPLNEKALSSKSTPVFHHTSTITHKQHEQLESSTATTNSTSTSRSSVLPHYNTACSDRAVQHKLSSELDNYEKAPRPNSNNSSPLITGRVKCSQNSSAAECINTDSLSTRHTRAREAENTSLTNTVDQSHNLPAKENQTTTSPLVFSPISDADSDEEITPFMITTTSSKLHVDVTTESQPNAVGNSDCDFGEEKASTSVFMPKIIDVVSLSTQSDVSASHTSTCWPPLFNALNESTVTSTTMTDGNDGTAREKVIFKIKPSKTTVVSSNKTTILDDSTHDGFTYTCFGNPRASEIQKALANDDNSPPDNLQQDFPNAKSNYVEVEVRSPKNKQTNKIVHRKPERASTVTLPLMKARKKRVSGRGVKRNVRNSRRPTRTAPERLTTSGQLSLEKRGGRKSKLAQNVLLNASSLSKVAAPANERTGCSVVTDISTKQGRSVANFAGQKDSVELRDVASIMPAACRPASQDMVQPSQCTALSTGTMTSTVVSNGSKQVQQDTQILISLVRSQLDEMTKLRQRIMDSNAKQTQLFDRLSSIEQIITERLKSTALSSRSVPEQQKKPPHLHTEISTTINLGEISPTRKRPVSPIEAGDKTLQETAPKSKRQRRRKKEECINSTALTLLKTVANEPLVDLPSATASVIVQVSAQGAQALVNVPPITSKSQESFNIAAPSHAIQHVVLANSPINPDTIISIPDNQNEVSMQEEIHRAVMSITQSPYFSEDYVTKLSPILAVVADSPEGAHQITNSLVKLRKVERSKSMSPIPDIEHFKRRHTKRASTLPPEPTGSVMDYTKVQSLLTDSGESLTNTIPTRISKEGEMHPVKTSVAKSLAFSPAATAKVAVAAVAAAEASKPHAVVAIHPLLTPLIISENEELPPRVTRDNATTNADSPIRLVVVTPPSAAAALSVSPRSTAAGPLESQKSHETNYSKQSSYESSNERMTAATVARKSSNRSTIICDQTSSAAAPHISSTINQQLIYSSSVSVGHHRLSATDTEYHLRQIQEHPNHHQSRQQNLHHQPPYAQVVTRPRMSGPLTAANGGVFPFKTQFQPSLQYYQARFTTDGVRPKATMVVPRHGETEVSFPVSHASYVVEQTRHQHDYTLHHQQSHQSIVRGITHVHAPFQRLQHHPDSHWHSRQQQESAGVILQQQRENDISVETVSPRVEALSATRQHSPNVRFAMTANHQATANNNRPPYGNICQQPNCQKCEAELSHSQPIHYQYPALAGPSGELNQMRFGSMQASSVHRPTPYGMLTRPHQHTQHPQSKPLSQHGFPTPNIRQVYSSTITPPSYQHQPSYIYAGSSAGAPAAADVTGEDIIYVGTERLVPADASQEPASFPTGQHHRQTYSSQQQHRLPPPRDHYLPHPPIPYKVPDTASQPHLPSQGIALNTQQPATSWGQGNLVLANGGATLKPCDQCKMPAHLLCSGCRQGHYCSSTCQAASWFGGHNKVCRWMEQPTEPSSTSATP